MNDMDGDTTDAPERAHSLIAKVGADTAKDLARELRFMADRIDMDELSQGCGGGPSAGSIYSYKVRPVSHDDYFRRVAAWLAARKIEDA